MLIDQEDAEEQRVNPFETETEKSSKTINDDVNKDASDGFETASEAELDCDDDNGGATPEEEKTRRLSQFQIIT